MSWRQILHEDSNNKLERAAEQVETLLFFFSF